jgi:hypothetical protein
MILLLVAIGIPELMSSTKVVNFSIFMLANAIY